MAQVFIIGGVALLILILLTLMARKISKKLAESADGIGEVYDFAEDSSDGDSGGGDD